MDAIARSLATLTDRPTDAIVCEMPTRNLTLTGRAAIEAGCRAMFGSMAKVETIPGMRFATADHGVDDGTARFRLTGDGVAHAPLPVGSRVELRLMHLFATRDGRIARETVHEGWRRIG
jgi:hypothetical protein